MKVHCNEPIIPIPPYIRPGPQPVLSIYGAFSFPFLIEPDANASHTRKPTYQNPTIN